MCPSIWWTPTKGIFLVNASAIAATTPTNNAPTNPGQYVTPIASISSKVISAFSSASLIT